MKVLQGRPPTGACEVHDVSTADLPRVMVALASRPSKCGVNVCPACVKRAEASDGGCKSGACRTLSVCICTCKRCLIACASRKPARS